MPGINGARRSERLAFAIPITISGNDADGRRFKETSRTLVFSETGGLIAASNRPAKGSQIVIENPALSRVATAKVVWVRDDRTLDNLYEVGVEVEGADYLWPVEFHWVRPNSDG